jgi:hypothetical protein
MRICGALLLLMWLVGLTRAEDWIDSPMYRIPDFKEPVEPLSFPDKLLPLWLRALERPEVDLRSRAAATIALAQRRGMKGLNAAIAPLRALIERNGEHPTVYLGAARSLIELDARQTADALFARAKAGDLALRELIEPALARWGHSPSKEEWLQRLDAPQVGLAMQTLAIRCLTQVHDDRAVDRLGRLLDNPLTPLAVRLEAARGLGQLRDQGLLDQARRLASQAGSAAIPARIAACRLLRRHSDAESVKLLQQLLRDPEPTVAGLAGERLLQLDAQLLASEIDRLGSSADPRLRTLAVQTLARLPAPPLSKLADALADLHPEVRITARKELHRLSALKDRRAEVIAQAMRQLAGTAWQSQEQATILLVQLDHKPATARLLELLPTDRSEAFLIAAWGLRKLAVPDSLPGVVRFVEEELTRMQQNKQSAQRKQMPLHVDLQLAQLNQLLGAQKYRPAEKVLRRLLPRLDGLILHETRAAAFWAMGLLLDGSKDAALAGLAAERLRDVSSLPPEDTRVRWMAALLIGRLKANEELETLRKFATTQDWVGQACWWSIERISGEKPPPQVVYDQTVRDWFLAPTE